jgi:hypothetical protein
MPEETDPINKAECLRDALARKEEVERKLKEGDIAGATNTIKEAAKSIMGADTQEIYLSFSTLFMKIAEAELENRKKSENIGNTNGRLYQSGEFNDRVFNLYAGAAYMAKKGGDRRKIVDINSSYRVGMSDYIDGWDKVFTDIVKDVS